MSQTSSVTSVSAESDKYEVLEKIGMQYVMFVVSNMAWITNEQSGSGSFGIIRKVKRKSDGFILCRKEIAYLKMSQKEREQLMSEFNILSSLRHPNIVAYYHREHLKTTQELYLYMEYCGGGDLGMVIKNLKASNKYAEEEFVWRILSQLVTALYRCHYGVNPPEAGTNVLGPPSSKQPSGLKSKQAQVMILHRDLKPDNIFLGDDQSVKLGDFGLSKLMRSQDFASTYVGTPFYMSPEICAGEKYTLYSDIWAVGCIMYELCAKEPPFNARTHIQLIHKIRDGRFPSLPSIYSAELRGLIASCLKVNPQQRPDTAALLNNPVIRLMRKEMEVVDLSKSIKTREEAALRKLKEVEAAYAQLEKDKVVMKAEIEESVRREWEIKARAEIERQLQIEFEKLRGRFETEVQEQVAHELQKHMTDSALSCKPAPETRTIPLSSAGASSGSGSGTGSGSEDDEFPSSTDLSDLSLDSPPNRNDDAIEKIQHTPFSSKQKTVIESPCEDDLAQGSPMHIDTVYRSPASKKIDFIARRDPHVLISDEEDDDFEDIPSPSRTKFTRPQRPLIRSRTTSSMAKMAMAQSNRVKQTSRTSPSINGAVSNPSLRDHTSESMTKQPVQRTATSPTEQAARKPITTRSQPGSDGMRKAALQRNMGGRRLVELNQARAGGRPAEDVKSKLDQATSSLGSLKLTEQQPPAVWNPEVDEMPSPFIIKTKAIKSMR
ncbi:Suppressor of the cold-sensitive snRNP biogenesis mutant brr1-1 [Ascosphaera pollenicola]|nr:Suppressor of the cold-sensitive snRNP biogenesis mutant brr1-1 [Ascosphaera pollenicola]